MAILWMSFFYSARTFSSILSITCSAKEKEYTVIFHKVAFKCVFSKRDSSYSVFIPVFHGINMK